MRAVRMDAYLEEELYDILTYCIQNPNASDFESKKICPHMKAGVNSSHSASFKDHEDVIKHVDVVIGKTLAELKKLKEQNILPEDEITNPKQHYTDIKNNEQGQTEIDNGNGKEKNVQRTTPISQLVTPKMRSLIIKGRIESISGSQSVDLRSGGTAQVADAIIRDETGSIKLSLWDNQINSIKEGDIVIIEKGYTKDYRGEIILGGTVTKC